LAALGHISLGASETNKSILFCFTIAALLAVGARSALLKHTNPHFQRKNPFAGYAQSFCREERMEEMIKCRLAAPLFPK